MKATGTKNRRTSTAMKVMTMLVTVMKVTATKVMRTKGTSTGRC